MYSGTHVNTAKIKIVWTELVERKMTRVLNLPRFHGVHKAAHFDKLNVVENWITLKAQII